jgi:tripartite-type tricarboxylate transporter receptor subunit TctC
MKRRTFQSLALLGAIAPVHAQPGSDKPVRMILPYPAGSGLDVIARHLAGDLKQAWGQQPIIDNKPGGSGIVAIADFRKSAPDGQTLLLATNDQLVGNRAVYKSMPYDVDKEFSLVAAISQSTFAITAGQASGLKSIKDLLARAKASPGRVTYATLGRGTLGHLGAEYFCVNNGISMIHVPFRDLGSLTTAVGGNEVDLVFLPLSSVDQMIKAGRARPIATLSPSRQRHFPELPTLQEAGGGQIFHVRGWMTVVAPRATPQTLLEKVQADVLRVVKSEKFRERLAQIGVEPFAAEPAALADLVVEELKHYRAIAARPGMQLE